MSAATELETNANMLVLDLNALANMDEAQIAAAFEKIRQAKARLSESAVARGISVPGAAVRKLTPSQMFIVQRRVTRARWNRDHFETILKAATEEFNEVKNDYLLSHGITELTEDVQNQVNEVDTAMYKELTDKAAAPPKRETNADGTPVAPTPGRGRPRKAKVQTATEEEAAAATIPDATVTP